MNSPLPHRAAELLHLGLLIRRDHLAGHDVFHMTRPRIAFCDGGEPALEQIPDVARWMAVFEGAFLAENHVILGDDADEPSRFVHHRRAVDVLPAQRVAQLLDGGLGKGCDRFPRHDFLGFHGSSRRWDAGELYISLTPWKASRRSRETRLQKHERVRPGGPFLMASLLPES